MTIPGGYILQPRCIDESDIMREPPVVRELWSYLLRRVNHRDNGKYARGSGFFNLGDIQDDLCWYVGYRKEKYSKPQLTKSIRKLCERNMIETAKATRGLYITVLNYDYYQDPKNYESNGEEQTKETRRKQWGHTKNKNDKKEKKNKSTSIGYTDEFERFWSAYPKKVGKGAAFKAWKNLNGTRPEVDELIRIVEQQKKSEQWCKQGGQFIPNPQTWLNQARWEDELGGQSQGEDDLNELVF